MKTAEKALKVMVDEYPQSSKDPSQIRSIKARQDQFDTVLTQVTAKFHSLEDEVKLRL